ncbi:hypothetical protein [Acinetobacter ursingii]|uniref:hypothetical protein n=1 Tax=Acinetobacter ursingii TaxID=108980 RepID=UPI00148F059D|nr:hypothetical protein [Acinetobacter ursingii]
MEYFNLLDARDAILINEGNALPDITSELLGYEHGNFEIDMVEINSTFDISMKKALKQ